MKLGDWIAWDEPEGYVSARWKYARLQVLAMIYLIISMAAIVYLSMALIEARHGTRRALGEFSAKGK